MSSCDANIKEICNFSIPDSDKTNVDNCNKVMLGFRSSAEVSILSLSLSYPPSYLHYYYRLVWTMPLIVPAGTMLSRRSQTSKNATLVSLALIFK